MNHNYFENSLKAFKDKTLLITGGTGSFGSTVLKKLSSYDDVWKEIRVFSRDEKKQHDLRIELNNSKIKFVIGDVRDLRSVENATRGVDYIFHAAALKQVPSCEFFPIEAVKTNVLGTENVIDSAIKNGVEKVICLSTDKAAYPINAMGISKAMMEKVAVSKTRNDCNTSVCVTRYGNVMASRGSVIPLFINQIMNGEDLTITNGQMTRFLMSLDEAVDLVLYAFLNGENGDLFIQKSPACTINQMVDALKKIFKSNVGTKSIGIRHGEKMYETLATKEEIVKSFDLGDYYRIPMDTRDLNYNKYFTEGESVERELIEYNSFNTVQLNENEIIQKLLAIEYVQEKCKGI